MYSCLLENRPNETLIMTILELQPLDHLLRCRNSSRHVGRLTVASAGDGQSYCVTFHQQICLIIESVKDHTYYRTMCCAGSIRACHTAGATAYLH